MKKKYADILKEYNILHTIKRKKILKEIEFPFDLYLKELAENIKKYVGKYLSPKILENKSIVELEKLKDELKKISGILKTNQAEKMHKAGYTADEIVKSGKTIDSEIGKMTLEIDKRIFKAKVASGKIYVGGNKTTVIPPELFKIVKGVAVVGALILATYIIAASYILYKDAKKDKEEELERKGIPKEKAQVMAREEALKKQINALKNSGNNFRLSDNPNKTKNIIIEKIKKLEKTRDDVIKRLKK